MLEINVSNVARSKKHRQIELNVLNADIFKIGESGLSTKRRRYRILKDDAILKTAIMI